MFTGSPLTSMSTYFRKRKTTKQITKYGPARAAARLFCSAVYKSISMCVLRRWPLTKHAIGKTTLPLTFGHKIIADFAFPIHLLSLICSRRTLPGHAYTYNLLAAPQNAEFPEAHVERRTNEIPILLLDDNHVNCACQRRSIDFIVELLERFQQTGHSFTFPFPSVRSNLFDFRSLCN